MSNTDGEVKTFLEGLRFLIVLNGSVLFALNALIPLYPLGRQLIASGGPGQGGSQLTTAQIEALIAVCSLAVVVVFLPLYVRLVVVALDALKGGESP